MKIYENKWIFIINVYKGIVTFGQGTIKDPFLVRKYADVLSKRLSESYGHLVCFAILAKRQREREE